MADSNDAAFAELQALITRLRKLPAAAPALAEDVAKALDTQLREQIAAGTDPDGKPWPPTQAGERPLRNAGASLHVHADGPVVLATLRGPTALHHMGRAKGGIRRQILPSAKMPARLIAAIRNVVERGLARAINGSE
jgi:hypothetical protein